jgi:hypothetical protein
MAAGWRRGGATSRPVQDRATPAAVLCIYACRNHVRNRGDHDDLSPAHSQVAAPGLQRERGSGVLRDESHRQYPNNASIRTNLQ